MYVFGIAVLLALGAFTVALFADRLLSIAHEFWAFVLVGFGIGLAWLADFDIFRLWNIGVREDWIGVTLTGLMIGGMAYVFHGAFHLGSVFTRKVADEAETLETQQLKRVA